MMGTWWSLVSMVSRRFDVNSHQFSCYNFIISNINVSNEYYNAGKTRDEGNIVDLFCSVIFNLKLIL